MDYDDLLELVEEFEDYEMDSETFDDILDDCYPPFTMGSLEYYASNILSSCDPIAYNISLGEEEGHQREQMTDDFDCQVSQALLCDEITQEQHDELRARFDAVMW